MYQVKDPCGALPPITEDNVVCHCSKCGKEIQVNLIDEMTLLCKHNAPLTGSVVVCKECVANQGNDQIQSYKKISVSSSVKSMTLMLLDMSMMLYNAYG